RSRCAACTPTTACGRATASRPAARPCRNWPAPRASAASPDWPGAAVAHGTGPLAARSGAVELVQLGGGQLQVEGGDRVEDRLGAARPGDRDHHRGLGHLPGQRDLLAETPCTSAIRWN